MPIEDEFLPARFERIAKARIGRRGDRFPERLKCWRFTSQHREYLEELAEVYGGDVVDWPGAPDGSRQWELITTTDTLEVRLVPTDELDEFGGVASQNFELWSGAQCLRRCTGRTATLQSRTRVGGTDDKPDYDYDIQEGVPCACAAELAAGAKERKCKPTTRLNFMVTAIPEFAVVGFETGSYHAGMALKASLRALIPMVGAVGLTHMDAELKLTYEKVPRKGGPMTTVPIVRLHMRRGVPALIEAGREVRQELEATNGPGVRQIGPGAMPEGEAPGMAPEVAQADYDPETGEVRDDQAPTPDERGAESIANLRAIASDLGLSREQAAEALEGLVVNRETLGAPDGHEVFDAAMKRLEDAAANQAPQGATAGEVSGGASSAGTYDPDAWKPPATAPEGQEAML